MKLYTKITIIFSIWLISVLILSSVSFFMLPHSGKFTNNFFTSLSNWDGGHYLAIAKDGYKQKFQYAFFPLFPLVIRLLNQLTNNYLLAAVLISVISAFLGIQLLYRLISEDLDKKIAEKVIFALLFFPASFFFIMTYSEGLFF